MTKEIFSYIFIFLVSILLVHKTSNTKKLKNSFEYYLKSLNKLSEENNSKNLKDIETKLDEVSLFGLKFLANLFLFLIPYIFNLFFLLILKVQIDLFLSLIISSLPYLYLFIKR